MLNPLFSIRRILAILRLFTCITIRRLAEKQMLRSLPWFDLPMACLGAVVSGVLVGWINFEHGFLPAMTAALKQASYAFIATGLIIQLCRWLNRRPVARILAIGMAICLPLLITMVLLYLLHSMKGTAEPLYSIIPGSVLTLIGLVLVSWRSAIKP